MVEKLRIEAMIDALIRTTRGRPRMDAEPIIALEDAADGRVWWRDDEPYCPACDGPLGGPESVRYVETYAASIGMTPFGEAVYRQDDTVDSTATCAACGAALEFDDVVS